MVKENGYFQSMRVSIVLHAVNLQTMASHFYCYLKDDSHSARLVTLLLYIAAISKFKTVLLTGLPTFIMLYQRNPRPF